MEFKIKHKNERDVEIPLLISFIGQHRDIKKALDVGCAGSFYVPQLRELLSIYDGIDLRADGHVSQALDHYFIGDVLDHDQGPYDFVSAISVIEHYGVKQKPVENYQDKQMELVKKIGDLSEKYIFLTFPFGRLNLIEGEFAIVDDVLLSMFEDVLSEFKLEKEFYLNAHPSGGFEWTKVEQGVVGEMVHDEKEGVSCVCVLKGVRDEV